ncbi:MFS transporter [Kitasatospora sp. NPDC048365]|uniref:MFS transporter n=1 Tax=Kitasatospora sp. NPDC048365 TaxID=3364050 RepID=UPI00371F9521
MNSNRSHAFLVAGHVVVRLAGSCLVSVLAYWGMAGFFDRHTPGAMAWGSLSTTVVAVPVALLAGVFADRWDQRRTMIGAAVVGAVTAGLAAVLAELLGPYQTLVPVLLTVLGMGATQVFGPARFAAINRVVDAERREHAAVVSAAVSLLVPVLLGGVLAGLLWSALGIGGALVVDAGLYVAGAVLLRGVRLRPADPLGPGRGLLPELDAGLRAALGSTAARSVLLALLAVLVGGSLLTGLGTVFVLAGLHAGSAEAGWLSAAYCAGLLLGTLVLLLARPDRTRVLRSGVLAAGGGLLLYGWLTSVWVALPVVFLIGAATAAVTCAAAPLLLAAVPADRLGRVVGVVDAMGQLPAVATFVVIWWAAAGVDVIGADRIVGVFGVAGLLALAAGGFLWWSRRADRSPVQAG